MAWIDTEVVRDGKWISQTETTVVPGEPCIDIHDGYGYYEYQLGTMPSPDAHCVIPDTSKDWDREIKFNEELKKQGLPPYFNIKEG